MKNSSLRKKVIAVLITLSLTLSVGTFAYWANFVEGTSQEATGTLEIGSGNVVETRFDLTNELNSGGLLVPVGQAVNSNVGAVEAIDLAFDVEWVEDEETTQLLGSNSIGQIDVNHTIEITVGGVVLDQEDYAHIYNLLTVSYNASNASELTLDAAAQTFAFQITLDEPADQAEYDLIVNASISITFSYEITTENVDTTDIA